MEASCAIALVLVVISNILQAIATSKFLSRRNSGNFSMQSWKQLDPDYIKEHFQASVSDTGIHSITTITKAIALFFIFVPIIQVSWILSNGGKKRLSTHVAICVLAIAGGMCELVVNLMMIGTNSMTAWLASSFNLDDWDSEGDGQGWRVLELMTMMMRGMMTWVNALEWISIFLIMTIIFFSIRNEKRHNPNSQVLFGSKWAMLGLVIGILGLFEFIADLLRLRSWFLFMKVSFAIYIINMLILLPIWLVVLGRQLASIKDRFEDWGNDEATPLNEMN